MYLGLHRETTILEIGQTGQGPLSIQVKIDETTFWNQLTASGLVSAQQAQHLRNEFHSQVHLSTLESEAETTVKVETVSNWLVEKKVLSPFQASILSKGAPGPFKYGNYTVVGRFDAGPLASIFQAVHQSTGHPVALQFFPGRDADDLERWNTIEQRVQRLCDVESPFVVPVHESVVLPRFRFVVSERPSGKTLFERVPWKSRLPWQDALNIVAAAAVGLQTLHQRGVGHGQLSTRTIHWSQGRPATLRFAFDAPSESRSTNEASESPHGSAIAAEAKITETASDYQAPEIVANGNRGQPDHTADNPAADIYSLGVVLYRLISGRVPFFDLPADDRPAAKTEGVKIAWDKYQVPDQIQALARSMLSPDPDDRPTSDQVLRAIDAAIPGQPYRKGAPERPETYDAYREQLRRYQPGSRPDDAVTQPPAVQVSRKPPTRDYSQTPIRPTRRPRWIMPVAIAAALLIVSGLFGGFAWYANQKPFVAAGPDNATADDAATTENPDKESNPDRTAEVPSIAQPDSSRNVRYLQTVVDDDGKRLWETPTVGTPIDFLFLPPAPRLILAWRPSDLIVSEDGALLVRSLGPVINKMLDDWLTQSDLTLDQVEQFVVSLHSVDFQYQPVVRIRLVRPVEKQQLLQSWGSPQEQQTDADQTVFVNQAGTAWLLIDEPDAPSPFVTRSFLVGPESLVREAADLGGASPLTGALAELGEQTDRDRHVNFLFLRHALFNDEGQKLMSGKMATFNRALDLALHDSIRGGLISLHLDQGTYLEVRWATTLDLKPTELRDWMEDALRTQRDRLMELVATLPPNPYWDRVRARFGGMLSDLYRHVRIGIERDQVIANAWLPPMAAHNLLASSELLIHFADSFAPTETVASDSGPQSIEQLLQRPRNLKVTTNPDLNILLADLQAEILDEYGNLPFPFAIKILGNDLLIEGITKNQRPGEFDLEQKPLAEILTEIMVRANPSKDITGPSDPNCKLVWVLGPDPDNPDQRIILVTTRAAAKTRGYELPEDFRQP